jgi:hypothetical protein
MYELHNDLQKCGWGKFVMLLMDGGFMLRHHAYTNHVIDISISPIHPMTFQKVLSAMLGRLSKLQRCLILLFSTPSASSGWLNMHISAEMPYGRFASTLAYRNDHPLLLLRLKRLVQMDSTLWRSQEYYGLSSLFLCLFFLSHFLLPASTILEES